MKEKEDLFAEFKPVLKAEWLEKVIKDLKGKSLESLDWQLSDELQVSPFAHSEDLAGALTSFAGSRTQNSWAIGEDISLGPLDEVKANLVALKALEGGAEALRFSIAESIPLDNLNIQQLLTGIHLNMVSCHFVFAHPVADVKEFFNSFYKYLQKATVRTEEISGSFGWNATIYKKLEPTQILSLLEDLRATVPGLCKLRLDGAACFMGTDKMPEELAGCLSLGRQFFNAQLNQKSPPFKNVSIGMSVGIDYLAEIAKVRAMKILWANLLKAYELETTPLLQIDAQFAAQSLSEDTHENMIKAATQAMSAVTGGATILYVAPADIARDGESSDFTRRIARNVQHLLRTESYMDRVVDPAAGSYYIEKLTRQLAEAAWKTFVKG